MDWQIRREGANANREGLRGLGGNSSLEPGGLNVSAYPFDAAKEKRRCFPYFVSPAILQTSFLAA